MAVAIVTARALTPTSVPEWGRPNLGLLEWVGVYCPHDVKNMRRTITVKVTETSSVRTLSGRQARNRS